MPYKPTEEPAKEPESKKDEVLKFNFEMPMNNIFEHNFEKESPKEETPKEPEYGSYGKKEKKVEEPKEEKKKEFEFQIPQIDIEKMMPSLSGMNE